MKIKTLLIDVGYPITLAIAFMLCGLWLVINETGCTTSQQTVVYKTLYGVEVATTGAYDGYALLVAKGSLPTNDVPTVSHAYNKFQSSFGIAVMLARGNTNSLAPVDVVADSDSVLNLISTVKSQPQ